MSPLSAARRKNRELDNTVIVLTLHDLFAFGGRRASLRRLQNRVGNRYSASDVTAALDSALVTDHGDGTYSLTDAGLIFAREHPRDRSWS